jgi:DNA-directed RNA polymerase specialized sigma24 family protein
MDDERRRTILSDRAVHDAIRVVARKRGIPPHDVDEILDAVIVDAMDSPNLPLDDAEEAKAYLCGAARNKSIDAARAQTRRGKREVSADAKENEAAPGSQSPEDKAHLERVEREAKARFPRTFPWFWRHAMNGESHVAIAVEHNVSPAHVRKEVFRVRRAMQVMITASVIVLLIVSGYRWWGPGRRGLTPDETLANSAAPPTSAPSAPPPPSATAPSPAEQAMALRARAKTEFAQGDWEACMADLDEAAALEPSGETAEWRDLRVRTDKRLMEMQAKPGMSVEPPPKAPKTPKKTE